MIPKIIHYCWLSDDPIPESLQKCMNSWKEKIPEYEFKKWDFTIFPKSESKWVEEAFDNKKYAFAADYMLLSLSLSDIRLAYKTRVNIVSLICVAVILAFDIYTFFNYMGTSETMIPYRLCKTVQ